MVVGSGVRFRIPLMLGARKGVAMLRLRHILLALPELVDEVAKTLSASGAGLRRLDS